MKRENKLKIMKMLVIGWLVLVSCKAPDFLSGVGDALGNMFRSFGP